MTTHRSLNKLEYKAHMSIHNTAEVSEAGERHDSGYTRDRLGRSHKLFEGDGTSRIFKASVFLMAASVFAFTSPVHAIPENISVSSDEFDDASFNDRLGNPRAPEKFSIFDDGSNSVGFNDNGDPNVAMRF